MYLSNKEAKQWMLYICKINVFYNAMFCYMYLGFMGGSYTVKALEGQRTLFAWPSSTSSERGWWRRTINMGGAEYGSNAFGPSMCNDVPFAGSIDRSVIMIPGTNVCTPGWNLQYHGLLASGHESKNSATEFICVDHGAESIIGGERCAIYGRIIYTVWARCGSLECPPYHNSKELTCVICTK